MNTFDLLGKSGDIRFAPLLGISSHQTEIERFDL